MSAAEHTPGAEWFDVEPLRAAGHRVMVVRRVTRAAVVLGSTQDEAVVDRHRAAHAGVHVVRRRSGGGAVLVQPGDPWWIDLWIPRGDPLFVDDVGRAPEWVGECWVRALRALGAGADGGLGVHRGAARHAAWSDLVCFAGVGPGEVVAGDRGVGGARKVVGIAQWRARQGALFHCAAYRHWDPTALADLLVVPSAERESLTRSLGASALGLDAWGAVPAGSGELEAALVAALPSGADWEIRRG